MTWLRCLLCAFVLAASAAAQPADPGAGAAGLRVASVNLVVDDLDRSVAFYTSALNFRQVGQIEAHGDAVERFYGVFGARVRRATLALGDERIVLSEFLTPRGRPIPRDSRSNDRWFQHIAIVTTDMDRAFQRLRDADVGFASTAPQTLPDWNPNAGGIRAFYFRDPDDHVLEVIQFPPGKGDPRWQQATGLFPGIDHTAIVVDDTDASLAFYRDALGLRVAGGSENWGPEQERLNNVFGARLRITTLRGDAGPGIELLEYLAPAGGRPYPRDAAANDLAHWTTTLHCPDARALFTAARRARAVALSGDLVDVPDEIGFDLGAILRDPDGHALELAQP